MSEHDNIRVAEETFAGINAHDIGRDLGNYADDYSFKGPGTQGD